MIISIWRLYPWLFSEATETLIKNKAIATGVVGETRVRKHTRARATHPLKYCVLESQEWCRYSRWEVFGLGAVTSRGKHVDWRCLGFRVEP